jgi:hypothetical protein
MARRRYTSYVAPQSDSSKQKIISLLAQKIRYKEESAKELGTYDSGWKTERIVESAHESMLAPANPITTHA